MEVKTYNTLIRDALSAIRYELNQENVIVIIPDHMLPLGYYNHLLKILESLGGNK